MSDELLPYYNRELAFIRKMGAEFAEAHPKIAGRLRLDADSGQDPHVDRMVEAFAYLNARTRHKLDDDFPEISEAMLGILYPHYLAPIPSASIIQFELDREQGELTTGYRIERGSTIESEPIEGQPCRFQTCYDVTLWPVELTTAGIQGQPFSAPRNAFSSRAKSVLRMQLNCMSDKVQLSQLDVDSFRFYLKGPSQYIYDLYELVLNNTIGIAVGKSESDSDATLLNKDNVRPVGFRRDDALVEYPSRSFWGYRLLTEYFSFPEKFLFFDITGLTPQVKERLEGTMEVYIYFNRHAPDLDNNVTASTFLMGCCPMINLFKQRAEPIQLSQTEMEYRVVPDIRRPQAHEVYSIDRVVATSPNNEEIEFRPFYSVKHGEDARRQRTFWHSSRRPAGYAGGQIDKGTEIYLSLVDLDFRPSAPTNWTLDIETTCLNRDLPNRLPFGGGQPKLQLSIGAPLHAIRCVTAPSPTRRASLRHGTLWKLISHLSLNHLSLADNEGGADALREILKLYDYMNTADTSDMIDGVLNVQSQRIVGRVGGDVSAGFCRGLEVTVHLDEGKFSGSGVFLFASVLEKFMGLYTSINSFTQTVATTNKREEVLRRWPPRASERVLL